MSDLLKTFMQIDEEYRNAAKAPWEKDDFEEVARLDDIRHEKQEPLLARMSRADLLWIYNNYLGTGMGKTTFRRKYLDTYAARHGRASKGSGDDLAAAIG